MGLIILLAKSLLILFFLIAFIRTSKPAWGIGLLTVTSAILLDAFLGTLGREEMMAELGFFLYVIAGALIAGTTLWMWAILRDFVAKPNTGEPTGILSVQEKTQDSEEPYKGKQKDWANAHEEWLFRASHEDLMDLIFDLGWSLDDIKSNQDKSKGLGSAIMSRALDRNQIENLRVAIEHIVKPPPTENLPRKMKLKPDTPPMILRHYILRHFSLDEIDQMAAELGVDMSGRQEHIKRLKARLLLGKLIEKRQLAPLIDLLKKMERSDSS